MNKIQGKVSGYSIKLSDLTLQILKKTRDFTHQKCPLSDIENLVKQVKNLSIFEGINFSDSHDFNEINDSGESSDPKSSTDQKDDTQTIFIKNYFTSTLSIELFDVIFKDLKQVQKQLIEQNSKLVISFEGVIPEYKKQIFISIFNVFLKGKGFNTDQLLKSIRIVGIDKKDLPLIFEELKAFSKIGLKRLIKNQNSIFLETLEDNRILKYTGDSPEILISIARKFQTDIPLAVCITQKECSHIKTIAYRYLAQLETWSAFLNQSTVGNNLEENNTSYIWPLIIRADYENLFNTGLENTLNLVQPINIQRLSQDKIRSIITTNFHNILQTYYDYTILRSKKKYESYWTNFWTQLILDLFPDFRCLDAPFDFIELQKELKSKNKRIVFLIDGLEDIFTEIETNEVQQAAIRGLCQTIAKLKKYPNNQIGLLFFGEKDFFLSAKLKNLKIPIFYWSVKDKF